MTDKLCKTDYLFLQGPGGIVWCYHFMFFQHCVNQVIIYPNRVIKIIIIYLNQSFWNDERRQAKCILLHTLYISAVIYLCPASFLGAFTCPSVTSSFKEKNRDGNMRIGKKTKKMEEWCNIWKLSQGQAPICVHSHSALAPTSPCAGWE